MTTRRSFLTRLVAALSTAAGALAFTSLTGHAAHGVKRACSRLGQPCGGTTPETAYTCCPGLVCEDGTCCTPAGEHCREDDDCCGAAVCVANPHGLGHVCAAA